jgi:hypothetical protein
MNKMQSAVIVVVGGLFIFAPWRCVAQEMSTGEVLDLPSQPWQMPAAGGANSWVADTNSFVYGGASLRAEVHDFWDATGFSTTLVGPGTLVFWYNLSGSWNSSFGQNAGRFVVYSGFMDYLLWTEQDTDWTPVTLFLPEGTNTVTWSLQIGLMPSPAVTARVDHVEFQPGASGPSVDIQPTNVTFVPGSLEILEASAGGTPPLAYQWCCNGSPLAGATASWLDVYASIPGQTNRYSCLVSNPFGAAVSPPAYVYTLGGPRDPWIRFTFVPPVGLADYVRGLVGNVTVFSNYVIAAYIYAEGGWWTKPFWDSAITLLEADGSFAFWPVSGGEDISAPSMMAFLLPAGSSPPRMSGECCLPYELFRAAVAVASVSRVPGVPTLTTSLRPDGVLMLGLEGGLPGHRFAIQRSSGLADQSWVVLPGSTNLYGGGVEFEYHPQPSESTAFFRGIAVP